MHQVYDVFTPVQICIVARDFPDRLILASAVIRMACSR